MIRAFLSALAIAAATTAAAQGVTADTIVLGQSAVFTGPAQDLGIEMRNGAMAYFNYINAQGACTAARSS